MHSSETTGRHAGIASQRILGASEMRHDTDCNEPMMKKGFTALKNGIWEEYQDTLRNMMKASGWAFDRSKEAFEKVAQDEAEKVSIVQEIMLRSTDYLLRIIAPVGGQGGVTKSYLCPHCKSFPLEDGSQLGKTTQWWSAICGEKYDWRQPNRLVVVQTRESVEQAKVFKAHAVPQGLCENLINAKKLLDVDGLLQNIVKDLGKESRKGLTDGLREFIEVDNGRALDVGSLRWGTGRKPKVLEGSSNVIVRES